MSETEKPKMRAPDPAAPVPDIYTADNTEVCYAGEEAVAQLVAEGWTATPFIPASREFAYMMQRPAPHTDSPEDQTA